MRAGFNRPGRELAALARVFVATMVAFRLAARLLLLLAAVHTAHADAVVKLSEANFDQLTAATDAERAVPHFVEFFGAHAPMRAMRTRCDGRC